MTQAEKTVIEISDTFGSHHWDQIIDLLGQELADKIDNAAIEARKKEHWQELHTENLPNLK